MQPSPAEQQCGACAPGTPDTRHTVSAGHPWGSNAASPNAAHTAAPLSARVVSGLSLLIYFHPPDVLHYAGHLPHMADILFLKGCLAERTI